MPGARSPEELELLLEDAFVVEDPRALAHLFEDEAVLSTTTEEARGGAQIGRLAEAMWRRGGRYVASPRRVIHARDTALVLGAGSAGVAHRRRDGEWRYTISHIDEGGTR